ncbi:MAG: response regulator [Gammaproteobacteria bacterium]|jgi:DNA-binding response OmpR family regulator|nr:response regulator [Gammaproteobacteria bacterium]MBU0787795.1 response regulator [Gammaproteobacteria bacterium]MBU0817086.1 response regulator [Gammaproteobacteria bacterium]MBU1787250.1 response regulator [Gammaproteobacteria bacterium]
MTAILVADDHPDIVTLLSITLGQEFEIIKAHDGETALSLIRNRKPSGVVLDIMMPGLLDGLQVLQQIRHDPELKNTVVAMVTARGQKKDVEEGELQGADGYFIKPFSPLELVRWFKEKLHE